MPRSRTNLLLDNTCPVDWQHPLNRGLVAEWAVSPLSGWNGANVLRDLVRGGKTPHNGSVNSGIKWVGKSRTGDYGALSFDNTDTHNVSVPYSSVFDFPDQMTISVWYKSDDPSGSHGILEKTIGGTVNTQYLLFISSGQYNWRTANGGLTTITGGTTNTAWHHLVGTNVKNGGTSNMFLYLDGQLIAGPSANTAGRTTGNGVLLIGELGSNVFPWSGLIDSVAIYNRGLSATEVAALYDQSRRGNPDRWRWLSRAAFFPSSAAPPATLPARIVNINQAVTTAVY